MQDHLVLSQVTLGYSPLIDRRRAVAATRLTVFPERPDAGFDAGALLALLAETWPAPDAAAAPKLSLNLRPHDGGAGAAPLLQPLSLNIAGEAALDAVLAAQPAPQLMVEVPAFMADARHAALLQALREGGGTLLVKGRPTAALPPALLGCFSHAIADAGDAPVAGLPLLQAGVRTQAAADAAFARGALATFGWPFDDAVQRPPGRAAVPQDVQVVLELIDGVDRELPVAKLEATLKKDPALAFRLMRYLNSPAFGLSVEINSFGHALMILGSMRLKRWLALLLASSAKGANAKPVLHAAVRRGLLMEELGKGQGDAEMRGEMFICGVFSLLDRLLQTPFSELLKSVPVPDRVQQALLHGNGPFEPYLALVRAVESESLFDIRDAAEALFMTPGEVNRSLLATLAGAAALD